MMGSHYTGSGAWMWMFAGLMIWGVLVLIGLAVWALITVVNRPNRVATGKDAGPTDDRAQVKQIVDERYARGELSTEEYSERLHTLGMRVLGM